MLSTLRSRHTPEQFVKPVGHDTTQVDPVQIVPEAHARPQAPQLLLSVVRSRHTPEQLVCPEPHVTVHAPAVHT